MKNKELIIITQHLATLLTAGIPLAQALQIVANSYEQPLLRSLLASLKNAIIAGNTFADALRKHPSVFNQLYISLIDAGEKSGNLDTMLLRVANHLEKTQSLKAKVKNALFYPATVLVVAMFVCAVLLIFVVPQFEMLFSSYDAELPWFTRWVVNLSKLLQADWWIILLTLFSIIYAAYYFHRTKPSLRKLVDKMLLHTKIIGPIIKKITIARCTRTLATTLSAGIPITDALQTTANVATNSVYTQAILRIRDDVAIGQQLNLAMSNTSLFPNMTTQMIAVGEATGSIKDMLTKVANYYEAEIDTTLNNLSSLLEPIILLLLSIIIGSFILSMYLPIFRLGTII